MANRDCSYPYAGFDSFHRSRLRFAHRVVRALELTAYAWSASPGGHSSRTIIISDPIVRWMSTTDSGVKSCAQPSRCDWKRTPPSEMVRLDASEKTWYPPESVRIGPDHCMNLWSPPAPASTSTPGLR